MVFIRERKKGITTYYEAVETVRENGKVSQKTLAYLGTRRKMLDYCKRHGIKTPNESELLDEHTATILEKKLVHLNKIRPLSHTTLESLRKKFEVEMTYNSNAIEGNRLSLKETFLVLEKGMTIGGKSVKEHLEAVNHKEAILFLEKLANNKNEINEADILELHSIIMTKIDSQNAGFYRPMQVYITQSTHRPPPFKEVPELMKRVLKELNSKEKGRKAVESATRLHHLFVWIHPFVDGNGRTARLLTNLRLMRATFPPIILEKKIRMTYYRALETGDSGDLKPLAGIIARDAERALDLFIEAAN
ncbi:Fic family protein [Candidatus Micrarchaeota archaeon]|nr:Fic family protein [Candidatus Micrarchaeota archaeon]